MKKQIRILVRTNSLGNWAAGGWHDDFNIDMGPPEEFLSDFITRRCMDHVVLVEVEFPEEPMVKTVPGVVISSEEKHD